MVQACGNYETETEDISEVITTMTEVSYYDLHILLCHYCNWGEPERAPPRALQRLRSLSHNNVILYVLAPVYKRLYFIRDVTYISRAHALRANVKPAH